MKRPKELNMKRLKDINWNQVYYFHEVAKRGSMKDAAQALGVSKPTVSEQIKKLEELLEIELFQRSARRIELTAQGTELYHCSREMFAAGVRFLDKVSLNPIGGYSARVGVQETISAAVALNFLYKYEELFTPFGTVNPHRETDAETLFFKVLRGELDWGITIEQPRHSRLEYQEIGSFDLAFCCSEAIYSKFSSKEDILRHLPLARSISDQTLNQRIANHLDVLRIVPEEIVESDYREFLLGLAHRGRCVAPIATKAVEFSPWRNLVRTFTVGGPITVRFYATWTKSNERMVAIRKLLALLAGPTATPNDEKPADRRPGASLATARNNAAKAPRT